MSLTPDVNDPEEDNDPVVTPDVNDPEEDNDPVVTPDVNDPEEDKEPVETPDSSETPDTGDDNMIWLWTALLIVSVCGVAAITVIRKKKYSVR